MWLNNYSKYDKAFSVRCQQIGSTAGLEPMRQILSILALMNESVERSEGVTTGMMSMLYEHCCCAETRWRRRLVRTEMERETPAPSPVVLLASSICYRMYF